MPQLYKECQRLIQESRENRFFQMAHTIRQLLEKGNLFSKPAVMLYGSLEKFSRALWRVFTTVVLDLKRLKACLSQRCQIRFNSS